MPIRPLPEEVVAQIAAGEVVERPASVVKELIENAIDAGARTITVEVRGGGRELIRVTDDGCGIPAAEAELAFQRHSTSKLQRAEDLLRITTLGFRGEALASIAAVSRVTLITRAIDEPIGTVLRLEGGEIVARKESGRAPGTTVVMEDLFFNVPARRKFLRSEQTERRHIDACVTRYAMAYPGIAFTLSHEGRLAFQSPGSGRLRDVLVAVYGLEVGAALVDLVSDSADSASTIRVSGLVSPPSLHRADRSMITLFVNGRWVQDAGLTYAVIQAYHTLIPTGRYPIAVVSVRLPPEDVDVNVHPAKAEVRFRDSDLVFRQVQKAVRRTVIEQSPAPSITVPATVWPTDNLPRWEERRVNLLPLKPPASREAQPVERETTPLSLLEEAREPTRRLPPLRVVGQLSATYIVAEGPEGMYLLDQHAAHERVLFEQLLAAWEAREVPSQLLLQPALVELAPTSATILEEHMSTLEGLGFQIEPFGGRAMLVRAVPQIAAHLPPTQLLEEIATALLSGTAPLANRTEELIVRQICKQAAVKAGQILTHAEMEELVRALERTANPHTCPHGRPTMIHLSAALLARQFGR